MAATGDSEGGGATDRESLALYHFLNYLRNPDVVLASLQVTGVSAKEAFLRRTMRHVVVPLALVDALPHLVRMALPGELEAISILSEPEFRRIFAPPLNNYLMSCLEIFLEGHFVETYAKPDGTKYASADDWKKDKTRFAGQFSGALGKSQREAERWVERFSFQRLPDLEELYRIAISIDLRQAPQYNSISILWKKRHLFTHRAGLIDQKFIDEYNALQQADPSQHLRASAAGMDAYVETIWVMDSVRGVKEFVNYIAK